MKVLVTGASRGIGLEIAIELLSNGYEVILHCNKNKNLIQKKISSQNKKASIFSSDISTLNGVKKLIEFSSDKFGYPDVIVNNAGIAESSYVDLDLETWSKMFDKTMHINLKAPALICKEFIKIKRLKKIRNKLRIINISSRAAFRGEVEDFISYACSKGGLVSLTKTIAKSFGLKEKVLAFTIAPGFVNTEMAQDFIKEHGEGLAKKGIVLSRLTEPKDIAPLVSFIASGKMDHSTGSTIDVNAGSYMR